jgi:hypothetical protein
MDFNLWLPVPVSHTTQNPRPEHLPKMDAFFVTVSAKRPGKFEFSERLIFFAFLHHKPWAETASDDGALSPLKFDSLNGYGADIYTL